MKIHLNYLKFKFLRFRLFLICFVFSGFLFSAFGTNFYIDNNANGSNNGTSWVNAWESFSSINWGSIQPGDIIFISGGTSSKTYNSGLTVNASGSSGSPITITKGIDSGHNGEVILQGSYSGTGVNIIDESYIKVSNLTINDWFVGVNIDGNSSDATHHITIDNCDGRMSGRFIFIQGHPDLTGSYCHDITIRNCDSYTPSSTGNQNDFVYAQYMGGLTVENCSVNIASNDASQHNDCIQTYYVDGPVTVRNNYFEHSDTKQRNSQGLFFENHEGNYYVYNNIIVMPNSLDGKIYWKSSSLNNAHTFVYSNVSYGSSGSLIKTTDPNAVIKNNILYSTGYVSSASSYMLEFNGVSGSGADVSNNLFYDPAGNMNNMNSGTNQNGVEGNPLFTNISTRDFTLQTGSPAIDAGATLESPYNVDMLGVSRPQGSAYDIGVYEKIIGGGGNNPPNQPTNPNPTNGEVNQPISLTLTWNCSDPNGDPLTYDVYFGTSSNPSLVSSNQSSASYNPGQLINSTTYYWKIVAKDNNGASTTGPIWSFSTTAASGNDPPNQPSNPNPGNGTVNQSINTTLSWSCSDPNGDPLTYDVYFGTSNNPSLTSGNQTSSSYNPGQLNNSTTYYWKIVAKDNQGGTTEGPVWSFSTLAAGGGGDVIPPELIGVQTVESDQVVLDFSEPLDSASVANPGNYLISDQIQVLNAELSTSQERITLTTDQQILNHIYTIAVNNLTDTAGNVISSQANSLFYKLLDIGSIGYIEHLINDVNASATTDTNTSPAKTLDGLVNGDPDPNSRWAAQIMPQWIQYDLGATEPVGLIAVSFYQWNAGRIYQYSIETSDDLVQWNEVVSNASSSSQEWTLNEFTNLSARYVRIVCLSNNQGDWAGVWEARIFEPNNTTAVEFTEFTAKVNENNSVTLDWTTASEQNCKQFNITRKKGNGDFVIVDSVPGHGSVTETQQYTFTDNTVNSGHYSYRLEEVDYSGHISYSNIIEIVVNNPQDYILEQNYPNPFNPTTTISYSVPKESFVSLQVYDILGNEISTLVNEKKPQGYYNIEFNAKDLPSGIYFSRIQAGSFVAIKKMILLK